MYIYILYSSKYIHHDDLKGSYLRHFVYVLYELDTRGRPKEEAKRARMEIKRERQAEKCEAWNTAVEIFLSTCFYSSGHWSLVGLSATYLPCLYGSVFVCCVVSRLSCLVMSLLPGKDYEEGVEKGARSFAGITGKMTRTTEIQKTLTDLRFARPKEGNFLGICCLPRRQRQQAKQQWSQATYFWFLRRLRLLNVRECNIPKRPNTVFCWCFSWCLRTS